MKKTLMDCFMMVFCLLVLSGCRQNGSANQQPQSRDPAVSETDSAVEMTGSLPSDSSSSSKREEEKAGDAYRVYTEKNTFPANDFNREVGDNPIDKAYESDLAPASTTLEISNVEEAYIAKWKEEMQKEATDLQGRLNRDGSLAFQSAQAEWEKQLLDNAEIDNRILNDSGVVRGSNYSCLRLSYLRKQYRDRTFHIIYMIDLIKSNGAP